MTSSNYVSSVISVDTNPTELLAVNNSRSALIIFNQGGDPLRWYFDDNSTSYFELPSGSGIHFPEPPRNAVYAISTGTSVVSVMEA